LRSTYFQIRNSQGFSPHFQFTGSGSGHGVGLCQWGARGMAEEGFSYKEILGHYYPDAKIKKVRQRDL
jgi:stage II sporulation protein D